MYMVHQYTHVELWLYRQEVRDTFNVLKLTVHVDLYPLGRESKIPQVESSLQEHMLLAAFQRIWS